MKRLSLLFTLLFLFLGKAAMACDVCQKNQPKVLQNITHGPGPSGMLDYIIIWSAVVVVVFTLYFSVKLLVKPRENGADHIKNIVKNEGF